VDAFVRSTTHRSAASSDRGGFRRDWNPGWTGSAVGALGRLHPVPAVALIATAVGLAWLGPFLAGGASRVPPHWFYVPILLAAVRFGIGGAIVTAVVSGVVAGPLLPTDVAQGTRQLPSDELMRAVAFLAIGTLMAAILRRLEASLRREAELARRETELAAHKAAVISTVSHEFRTPLTVLLGTSRMLLSRAGEADADRALLEGVDSAARRLNDLVTTVLAVSEGPLSAEDRIMTATPLREVVSAVAVGADPRDAARLRVEVGETAVWTAPAVLETLLRQLVANALRFSPPDAEVRIVDRRGAEDRVEVAVLDRGPGIDPRFLPKAFEPFTQQDPSGTRSSGGLGIGLFVVQRLAEYLGFDLDLRNREGGGTEAVVRLGRADSPAVADPARS
jgi:two-component system sensor histidine kinase SenX3